VGLYNSWYWHPLLSDSTSWNRLDAKAHFTFTDKYMFQPISASLDPILTAISFIWHVLKTISKGSCSLFKFQLELFSALSNIPGFANLIVDRQRVYTVQQTSLLCDLSFDPRPKIMLKFSPVTSYGLMSGLDPLTFYE
jgi:hypothetical protein